MHVRQVLKPLLMALVFTQLVSAGTALFNCGGPAYQAGNLMYQADQLYTTANGAGAIDGTAETISIVNNAGVIENSLYPDLYATQREGLTEYRFDVPNGVYLLTLGFAELQENGPGFRSFSVSAEGRTLLQNFDIFATASKAYAIVYQFAVPVTDGQLNVLFTAGIGYTTISTIGVASITPDTTAPPVPAAITGLGGYYRNIINWSPVTATDLAGYLVFSASAPSGPYTLLTKTQPTPLSRYFDDTVTPGQTTYYRVASIDVFGNVSGPTTAVSATPLDSTASTLSVYQLSMTPANLMLLETNPQSDTYVDADFTYEGVLYPGIGVRYRGSSSREYNKKSFKFNFNSSQEFGTKDKLDEKADAMDPAIFRECLGASIVRQTSALVENCGFSHLELNGEFLGAFNDLENLDQYFLTDHGLNPTGHMYEASQAPLANFQILPDYSVAWTDDSQTSDNFASLSQFIQTINNTSDDAFPSVISSVLNVNSYLDYYTSIILPFDIDHTEHNFEMYLNPDDLVWEVIGKDFDANFKYIECPIDYGTSASPEHLFDGYNILTDRLLNVPLFRQWYVNKLAERLQTDFTQSVLGPLIDSDHAAIDYDGDRDVYKRYREENTAFEQSPASLTNSIPPRATILMPQITSYSPGLTQSIEMNEVLASNVNGITDRNGDHEPWLEIYNPSSATYDLSGSYLTNNPTVPTMWQFPAGSTVVAGGYLLIWLDAQPAEGPNHANFTVSATGQALALYGTDAAGNPLIDTVAFGPQQADVSFGRRFSGSWLWTLQTIPTPLGPNQSTVITDVLR